MNKKIIAIGIIGMFLLAGLTTASASSIQSNETTNAEDNNTGCLLIHVGFGIVVGFIRNDLIRETAKIELYKKDGSLVEPDSYLNHNHAAYYDIPVGEYTAKVSAKGIREKSEEINLEACGWEDRMEVHFQFTIFDLRLLLWFS